MSKNEIFTLQENFLLKSKLIIRGLASNNQIEFSLPQGKYNIIYQKNSSEVTLLSNKISEKDKKNITSKPFNDDGYYDVFCPSHVISIFDRKTKNIDFLNIESINESLGLFLYKFDTIFMLSDCAGGVNVFNLYLNDKLVGVSITENWEFFEINI